MDVWYEIQGCLDQHGTLSGWHILLSGTQKICSMDHAERISIWEVNKNNHISAIGWNEVFKEGKTEIVNPNS